MKSSTITILILGLLAVFILYQTNPFSQGGQKDKREKIVQTVESLTDSWGDKHHGFYLSPYCEVEEEGEILTSVSFVGGKYVIVSTTTPEALAYKAELEKKIPYCKVYNARVEKSRKDILKSQCKDASLSFNDFVVSCTI